MFEHVAGSSTTRVRNVGTGTIGPPNQQRRDGGSVVEGLENVAPVTEKISRLEHYEWRPRVPRTGRVAYLHGHVPRGTCKTNARHCNVLPTAALLSRPAFVNVVANRR